VNLVTARSPFCAGLAIVLIAGREANSGPTRVIVSLDADIMP
jgi:hypothetical protein